MILFVPAGLEKIDSDSLTIGLLAAAIALVLAVIVQILIYRRILSKRKESGAADARGGTSRAGAAVDDA